VAQVRAWRANEAAIAQALATRMNVSVAETNAFLNGQNKVKADVQQFGRRAARGRGQVAGAQGLRTTLESSPRCIGSGARGSCDT